MLEKAKSTGVLDMETLREIPGFHLDALEKKDGPLVMIECAERIPCNPCETVCPFGAIQVGETITNLPTVIPEKCTGCGMCVAACPGLAIFLVNRSCREGAASVTFAYEYLPVPEKGDIVRATDRQGQYVSDAVVEKVVSAKAFDQTKVITISFPSEHVHTIRGIEKPAEKGALV